MRIINIIALFAKLARFNMKNEEKSLRNIYSKNIISGIMPISSCILIIKQKKIAMDSKAKSLRKFKEEINHGCLFITKMHRISVKLTFIYKIYKNIPI